MRWTKATSSFAVCLTTAACLVVSGTTSASAAPATSGSTGVITLPSAAYASLVTEDNGAQAKDADLVTTDVKGDSSPIVDDEDAQDTDALMTKDLAPAGTVYTFDNGDDTTPADDDVTTADDTSLFAVYRYGALRSNVPDADFADGWPCIPGNMWYCYRTNTGRKNSVAAMNYAHAHTSATSRYFVPFSRMDGGGRLRNRHHYVYVIYYKMTNGKKRTWKYGITSQNPFTKRTNRQVSVCNVFIHDSLHVTDVANGSCTAQWIALTSTNNGWGKARWLEASLVLAYVRKNSGRQCPPGQLLSCR